MRNSDLIGKFSCVTVIVQNLTAGQNAENKLLGSAQPQMGHLYHISPQGSRLIMGRGKGMEQFSKPEVREDQLETVFSEHDWLSVHMNS